MAGSRNRATLSIEQELQQRLRWLESQFLQFKNAQPLGVDSLAVASSATTIVGPVTIPAGAMHSFTFNVASTVTELTLWNFPYTVFIDTLTDPQKLPDGSIISAIAQKFPYGGSHDLQDTNPNTNTQSFKIWVTNNDTADHLCYIKFAAIRPRGA